MSKWNENDDVLDFNIEEGKESKTLSIYEIDTELKKYVFSPEDITGESPDREDI